jgi:hypothetical protein
VARQSASAPLIPRLRSFPPGWLVVVALAPSIVLFFAMIWGPLAELRGIAGGLDPFDMRLGGYDLAEARALLAALGAEGRDYYTDIQLRIDTLYPLTYALSRGLLLLWLALPGRASPRGFSPRVKAALLIAPVAACLFDWAENQGIAAMLASWPEVSPATVARASACTVAKSAASTVTECLCLALLASGLWCWLLRRRAGA